MSSEPIDDPELEHCVIAAVERGDFATVDESRASFWAKLDDSIAQADRGELHDVEDVRRDLHQRYADWPRAAE